MNYQPFSKLAVGAVFRDMDHPELLLMKTDRAEHALLLESVWLDNKLYARGSLIQMGHNECVIAVEDGPDLALPVLRKDPIDPRRKFWKQGDTRTVCRELPAKVNIFAGLFLYSGFGMGNYFSAVDNEIHWCDAGKAAEMAYAEGLPFVNHDTFAWTRDPDLKHEREEGQRRLEARRQREAEAQLAAEQVAA